MFRFTWSAVSRDCLYPNTEVLYLFEFNISATSWDSAVGVAFPSVSNTWKIGTLSVLACFNKMYAKDDAACVS